MMLFPPPDTINPVRDSPYKSQFENWLINMPLGSNSLQIRVLSNQDKQFLSQKEGLLNVYYAGIINVPEFKLQLYVYGTTVTDTIQKLSTKLAQNGFPSSETILHNRSLYRFYHNGETPELDKEKPNKDLKRLK